MQTRAVARSRGFTLIELMVVVIMVGILATMAAPSMLEAQKNRRAYTDSAQIMQLFRNARSRAIGDQAAVAVEISVGTTDRGTMIAYEATYADSTSDQASGSLQVQGKAGMNAVLDTCKAPASWNPNPGSTTAAHAVVVDGLNLNNGVDSDAAIHINVNGATSGLSAYCFTPSGKMYTWTGTSFADSSFAFSGAPASSPVKISVTRDTTTVARDVIIMPSGAVRTQTRAS